ncbi:MAG: capsular biosynthesis protein [Epsilonproteobacteria bacterium]|nr:MAG: capsular biosynthesis protein [Campylobacterota bacterium]
MFDKIKSKLASITKEEINLLHRVDLHSHLIPSIDDGVKSLDESISLIRQLQECGFKKIITTPHIMAHRYRNTKETIYEGYEALKNELVRLEIDIELEVASEYYHDQEFLDLIEKGEVLTFGDKYVLFELSYTVEPFMLRETVYKLREAGYKPVLAHPERYVYYDSAKQYRELKDMGLLFQINIISTQNFYGKRAKKAVEKIISLGMVDFIGSDIHSQKYMDTFLKSLSSNIYLKIVTKNKIKNNSLR